MPTFDLSAELAAARADEQLSTRDLISVDALSNGDIDLIFRVAEVFQRFIAMGEKKTDLLRGTSIFNFFNEQSTRTRSSFELAGKHLGSDVINISGSSSSTKKGETIGDTARTLDAYAANLLIVRDAAAGVPAQLAGLIGAPVLNAGDGWHEHPSQALINLFTMRQRFGTRPLTYLFVGDVRHSRVFGSEVRLYQRLGWEIRLASFETLIPAGIENWGVKVFHELEADALAGVDAVHAIRLKLEYAAGRDVPTGREYSKNFMLNPRRMALAKPEAVALHAGPVMREFDIGTPVLESPQSLVQKLVENGLPVRMALLWLLIDNPSKKVNPWKNA